MFAFDIETLANTDLIDVLPEPEVALGNTKDEEKIAAKIAQAKQKQIEKMALDPFFGRACSFATWSDEPGEKRGFHVISEISDAEEVILIKKILDMLCVTSTTYPSVITWNGYNFDFPFVFKRAILLQVEVPSGLWGLSRWCKRYSNVPHCDLMRELCGWNEQHFSLETASRMILGEGKTEGINYQEFRNKIESGEGEYIGLYNLKDVELTYNIYKKVSRYLW